MDEFRPSFLIINSIIVGVLPVKLGAFLFYGINCVDDPSPVLIKLKY